MYIRRLVLPGFEPWIQKMANQSSIRESFAEFFEGWEAQHRNYLDKLIANQNEPEESLGHLVEQVLCHYQEYYDEKRKAAESDVFLMFSPPWFSSFERTLLWATGFRPSMAFRLLRESVGGELSEEQNDRLAVLREKTRRAEKEIGEALASVQESVAAQPFSGLVKMEAKLVDGEVSEMENAVGELKAAMLAVMKDADCLRQHTAGEVLEVLTPAQKVKFLAGTSQFWLQSRRLGMERDRQIEFSRRHIT